MTDERQKRIAQALRKISPRAADAYLEKGDMRSAIDDLHHDIQEGRQCRSTIATSGTSS